MLHKVWNNWKGTVGSSNCGCTTLTFSSLLQKASNLPNIYISETSKDFSPEDSKICFLVLWKDVWYSLNRKMQSYERFKRGIVHSETLVYEWKIQKFYPHTKLIDLFLSFLTKKGKRNHLQGDMLQPSPVMGIWISKMYF